MQKHSNNVAKYTIGNNPHSPFYFEHGMIHRQLTCEQVAEMAHVHLKTAQRWANGTQTPSAAVMELLHLKATQRILPNNKTWLCTYFDDNQRLILPDGRDWIPQEIIATDYQRYMMHDAQREAARANAKLNAVISSAHLPNF